MRGISVVVIALVVIGATVVFLLTFSRIMEILLRALTNIERDAIINGIGMINLYTALSLGDFYYTGGIDPINAKNFSLEGPQNVTLVFITGNVTTTFDLNRDLLKAVTRMSEHKFIFPKRGVYGYPFKSLEGIGVEVKGIPFIKGMGKESTEYGYVGGGKIVERIVEVCRKKAGEEIPINATVNITTIDNKTIEINGVPYDLSEMECYISEVDISGEVQWLKISVTVTEEVTYIDLRKG